MKSRRRYEIADVLVVGSGVAGLSAALAASPRSVLLATKGPLPSGSSPYAQGGIAAALGPTDAPRFHADDTARAGRGLSVPGVVAALTGGASAAIERLQALGVDFDRDERRGLSLGREGGHRIPRIVHAKGDTTGAFVVRALVEAVARAPHVRTREGFFVVDLLKSRNGERVVGAEALDEDGSRVLVLAREVVLATGGLGQVYRHTTNPPEVTGDGIAMAARAGAWLADMEFVQFHPTTLDAGDTSAPRALLTEALRGAGAWLVDDAGRRFMLDVDPQGELAPRDVVAREVFRRRAWLDVRPVGGDLRRRFPTLAASCRRAGLDPLREPIPVTPAAHYVMGGVEADELGRTSLAGLWACGETASTGAHGANRLASNSLLEALVFGHELGLRLRRESGRPDAPLGRPGPDRAFGGEVVAERERVRSLMWEHAGVEREGSGLRHAVHEMSRSSDALEEVNVSSRALGELRNLALVGALVASSALTRRESRGSHFRSDYPETSPQWERRLRFRLGGQAAALEDRIELEASSRPAVAAGSRR